MGMIFAPQLHRNKWYKISAHVNVFLRFPYSAIVGCISLGKLCKDVITKLIELGYIVHCSNAIYRYSDIPADDITVDTADAVAVVPVKAVRRTTRRSLFFFTRSILSSTVLVLNHEHNDHNGNDTGEERAGPCRAQNMWANIYERTRWWHWTRGMYTKSTGVSVWKKKFQSNLSDKILLRLLRAEFWVENRVWSRICDMPCWSIEMCAPRALSLLRNW